MMGRNPNPATPPESSAAVSPEMEGLTIPQILSFLQSSSHKADFVRAERILESRQESLRAEIEQDFIDDLTLKVVEKIEIQARCQTLERNSASLAAKLEESEMERSSASEEAEKYRSACERLEAQIASLKGLYDAVCEREQRGQEKIALFGEAPSAEIEGWKKKCAVLEARVRAPRGVIELSDSEDDAVLQTDEKNLGAMEGDGSSCSAVYLPTGTPKRKCTSRVITSDSEYEDDDDKIPLSKLKRRRLGDEADCSFGHSDIKEDVIPPRRRLVSLRELDETKGGVRGTSPRDSTPQNLSLPPDTNKRVLRNRSSVCRTIVFSDDDAGSESEDESLDGFIVDDSDCSESKSSSNAASEDEEEQSDSDMDLDDVLAKIHREKDLNKWDYEADMLSAFAKNDELCMKAVCDLWRLQTDEEKEVKQAVVVNNRGFNKPDSDRGSTIAEFLTDGDRYGPLKKTVLELHEFDPQGVEYCRKLAFRYSGQLFSIYRDKKDCFTRP